MQFHLLSFEGPDPYARASGLASRVTGLAESLAGLGFETHLWFVGDPHRAGHERDGQLHLHRWCQWISRHHLGGVYQGEEAKAAGGLACTGSSGEDYAIAGQNALVLETNDPCEFITLFRSLRAEPHRERRLRLTGRAT